MNGFKSLLGPFTSTNLAFIIALFGAIAVSGSLKLIGFVFLIIMGDPGHVILLIGAGIRLIYLGIIVFLIYRLGRFATTSVVYLRNHWVGFVSLVLVITILANNWESDQRVADSLYSYIAFMLRTLSVSAMEELFFRVLIFSYLLERVGAGGLGKTRTAVLAASIVFGASHFINLTDAPFFSVLKQALLAVGIGIFLQSLFIKFRNVVLVIILHFILNYLGSFQSFFASGIDESTSGNRSDLGFLVLLVSIFAFSVTIMLLLVPKDPDVAIK